MPLNTKLPPSQSKQIQHLKKLSVAVALSLALPLAAHAADLGKLTVLSSLGQPLRAEIELMSVSAQEAGQLAVKLASADSFARANVDLNPVLSSLSFVVEQRGGRHFVRISSTQPVSDPFVDLLLELSVGNAKAAPGNARKMREYTFLLDPVDSRAPRNAQVTPLTPSRNPAPAATAASRAAPAAAAPATPAAAPANAPASAPAASAPEAMAATPAATPAATAPAPAPAPTSAAAPAAATAVTQPIPVSGEEPVSTIVQRPAPSALAEELIRRQQAAAADTPAAASPTDAAPAAAQSASGTVTRAEAPAAGTASAGAAPAAGKSGDYRVKQGDTLAGIAARNKQVDVSLDQMLVALYRANPEAFDGNNINRLRAGRVLAIPDQPSAAAVDQGEARGIVVAQAQDFNAYRNKLAAQVASAPARRPGGAGQSGSGKITTRVEERNGSAQARDRLELSRAGRDKGAAGNAGSAEDRAASERALAEANDRVKALEENVGNLQKLLELKNKTIAELSEQQKAPAAAAPAAAPADAAKPDAAPEPAAMAEVKPAESAALPAPAPAMPEPAPAAAPAPVMVATPEAKPVQAPAAQGSLFDNLQHSPYTLPIIGGLLALLVVGAGGVIAMRRRKKKAAEPAAQAAAEPEPAPAAQAAAVAAVAQAEAEAEPVVASVAVEEPVVEPPVDALAEADMYIAYGRDEQAEDILKLALQTEPEREALHGKLLEIYAKRQDVDSFSRTALELHQISGGLGEEWQKAAALGIVLDPTNALYGGKPEAPVSLEPEPEPEEQGLDFDLDDFKSAEIQPAAATSVDLGRDIDFDLDLENGSKPGDDEPILPPSTSASMLLDDGAGPGGKSPVTLADLDLDLAAEPAPAPSAVNLLDEDEESAFEAEMTTKLDLAAAYQEIGDKEGARELLEEVMRGGNDAQIARATEMLAKLA